MILSRVLVLSLRNPSLRKTLREAKGYLHQREEDRTAAIHSEAHFTVRSKVKRKQNILTPAVSKDTMLESYRAPCNTLKTQLRNSRKSLRKARSLDFRYFIP